MGKLFFIVKVLCKSNKQYYTNEFINQQKGKSV